MVISQQIGSLDVVLYADDNADISDMVLKKMGITPKPATPAAQQPATAAPATTAPKTK
jgi:outer membrane protein